MKEIPLHLGTLLTFLPLPRIFGGLQGYCSSPVQIEYSCDISKPRITALHVMRIIEEIAYRVHIKCSRDC